MRYPLHSPIACTKRFVMSRGLVIAVPTTAARTGSRNTPVLNLPHLASFHPLSFLLFPRTAGFTADC